MLEFLFMPEAVIGCIIGLLLAGIVHWFAPQPEPVMLEAGLVILGFIGGLLVSWISTKRDDEGKK